MPVCQSPPVPTSHNPPLVNRISEWGAFRRLVDEQLNPSMHYHTSAECDAVAEHFATVLQHSVHFFTEYRDQPSSEVNNPNFIRSLGQRR